MGGTECENYRRSIRNNKTKQGSASEEITENPNRQWCWMQASFETTSFLRKTRLRELLQKHNIIINLWNNTGNHFPTLGVYGSHFELNSPYKQQKPASEGRTYCCVSAQIISRIGGFKSRNVNLSVFLAHSLHAHDITARAAKFHKHLNSFFFTNRGMSSNVCMWSAQMWSTTPGLTRSRCSGFGLFTPITDRKTDLIIMHCKLILY